MSVDQADKLKAKMRERGVEPPAPPALPPAEGSEGANEVPELPAVEITPVIAPIAAQIGGILCTNGVFTRQRAVMTIDRAGRLVEMSAKRFRTYVEDHLITYRARYDQAGTMQRRAETIGVDMAATILESDQFLRKQRELSRTATVRQPVKRKDGRIELLPEGYDAESGTYTVPGGVEFALDMPLDAARSVLRDVLAELPLNDRKPDGTSRNEAAIIALMLSVFAAPLIGLTTRRLNAMLSSNSVGSGKTLIGQMIVIPTYGSCDLQPVPETEENWRKILDTETLAGSPVIFFDDIEGFFKSQILNAYLTAPTWSGRRMHSQSKFTVPKLATVILTGNNLEVSQDVSRRFLHVKMLVDEANPQERTIKREIDDAWLASPEKRALLLAAMWAIVREWDAAGRPRGKRVVRGYEEWCRTYAAMSEWAGFGDALEPLPVEDSGNTELADMLALIERLLAQAQVQDDLDRPAGITPAAGGWEVTFQHIVDSAVAVNSFTWALRGREKDDHFILDASGNSRFGKILSGFGGKKFRLDGGRVVEWDTPGKKRGKHYLLKLL